MGYIILFSVGVLSGLGLWKLIEIFLKFCIFLKKDTEVTIRMTSESYISIKKEAERAGETIKSLLIWWIVTGMYNARKLPGKYEKSDD